MTEIPGQVMDALLLVMWSMDGAAMGIITAQVVVPYVETE